MKNPKLIVKPFAKNGQKNVIPENYETSMESNQATWDQGFGQITMLPVAAGGLPPKGQDFNGIFNQISENIVYLSQGGRFKFSAEYAEAIGGYPKGAILQSDDEKKEYLSLIDNNKVDFNTAIDISASWKLVNTDDILSQIASKQPKGDYATKTELNSGLAGKQPTGDYATKTEVNSKLAKDENGADIPNKDTFIKNLGLGDAAKSNVLQGAGESKTDVLSQWAATLLTNQRAPKDGAGINAHSFRSNLGLGSVATRSVGLSAGDVPEMSYFSASLGVNGWFKIPVIINGTPATLIYQYGTKSCADRTVTNIDFPIPFPKNCFIFSSCAYQATGGVMVSATVHGADLVHGEASAFFNGEPAAAGYVQFKWYAIGLA
ncbi:gp53-like domain-containing protein [Morganella morganii]|nr:hypothetical protein [Morganella morganii]